MANKGWKKGQGAPILCFGEFASIAGDAFSIVTPLPLCMGYHEMYTCAVQCDYKCCQLIASFQDCSHSALFGKEV